MNIQRLTPLLAGVAAALFIAGCTESTAPALVPAADAEALASRPEAPPGKSKQQSDDYHDAYFASSKSDGAAGLDYWDAIQFLDYPPIPGAPESAVATMVPLCFGDGGFCNTSDRIFHGTWTTVVDEVPNYHRTRRAFTMYHRLDMYEGPGWYGEGGANHTLENAVYVGGFTTSNVIVCSALPCSTSRVRLNRKDWVPVANGDVTSFNGNVNLVWDSELDIEEYADNDVVVRVVVFRAHHGGIHGRAAFSWTAPEESS